MNCNNFSLCLLMYLQCIIDNYYFTINCSANSENFWMYFGGKKHLSFKTKQNCDNNRTTVLGWLAHYVCIIVYPLAFPFWTTPSCSLDQLRFPPTHPPTFPSTYLPFHQFWFIFVGANFPAFWNVLWAIFLYVIVRHSKGALSWP